MDYCYRNSTEIIFSKDVCEEIYGYANVMGAHKVFVLSGKNTSANYAREICTLLRNKLEVLLFEGITTNPFEEIINSAVLQARPFNPDMIITIGGGSVHDSGKAVSVLLKNNLSSDLDDYTVTGSLSAPGVKSVLPLITIPTIVGSGAEVSPAALVRIDDMKKVIFSPLLHPTATIINTNYMKSLPVSVLARSAFDSFVQSLEGYISTVANPVSDAFAIASIRHYFDCLDSLKKSDITDTVLAKLATASFLSSYVCSVASVGAIHALSDPISGRYNVHHGDALAMVAPGVLRYNLAATKADLGRFISIIGISDIKEKNYVEIIIDIIEGIISAFGIGENDLPVNADIISKMVPECNNPDMAGNPYQFSDDEIKEILLSCMLK